MILFAQAANSSSCSDEIPQFRYVYPAPNGIFTKCFNCAAAIAIDQKWKCLAASDATAHYINTQAVVSQSALRNALCMKTRPSRWATRCCTEELCLQQR
jgi:hypothetical protein